VTSKIETMTNVSNVIHALQKERGLTAGALASKDWSKVTEQRAETDSMLSKLKSEMDIVRIGSAMVESIERRQGAVGKLRSGIDDKSLTGGAAIGAYSEVIAGLIDVFQKTSTTIQDRETYAILKTIVILESTKESAGKLRALLNNLISSNLPATAKQSEDLMSLMAGVKTGLLSPGSAETDRLKSAVAAFEASASWLEVLKAHKTVYDLKAKGNYELVPGDVFASATASINELLKIREVETAELQEHVAHLRTSSTQILQWTLISVVLVSLAIIVMAFVAIRRLNLDLKNTIGQLQHSFDSMSITSIELRDTSQVLAEAASESAASLTQTAASLQEIGSMAQSNAENSRAAAGIASQNKESVAESHEAIEALARSMEKIRIGNDDVSSAVGAGNERMGEMVRMIHEIGEKTKVIHDIVFQTKLLSFNAAVEAARAGESGKGFAVVAEEVAKLAAQSGHAAKEIHDLVETRSRSVEEIMTSTRQRVDQSISVGREHLREGFDAVRRCEETLTKVVKSSNDLTGYIDQISRASAEEAKGVIEISAAVAQLDQATQLNSSSSERTAGYAEQVILRTNELEGVVKTLTKIVSGNEAANSALISKGTSAKAPAPLIKSKFKKIAA